MASKDQQRQRADQDFIASGQELTFGDAAGLPLPPARLCALREDSPGVEATIRSGLTAVVYKLRAGDRCYAVKRARPACLVQNADGQTSFLNELRRHAELRAMRGRGVPFPGVIAPLYGSLREGLLVGPWVEGRPIDDFDRRTLTQVFAAGRALLSQGFFEWDFSPGNLLDDGGQAWLFDFGYMYRFDPLTEFNSAGNGRDVPAFHLAERIETRAAFAWLLRIEGRDGRPAALAAYRMVKEVALGCYATWREELRARRADTLICRWLDGVMADWRAALADADAALERMYLREGWRSHSLDLQDDLHGQTCTPATLLRAGWLIRTIETSHAFLLGSGVLSAAEQGLPQPELLRRYQAYRATAAGLQLGGG
ncbi:MAG TPA: hypothetical protein VFS43_44390 [Polyangiaceae bacterium]|nr:hypothetical protein [Polyangiaceae bacterium]